MKPKRTARNTGAVSPIVVIAILLIGGVGSIGTLWWMGDLELPFLDRLRPEADGASDRSGKIAVPIAAREISAYTQVRRDDFWDPEKSEFTSVWIDEDIVKDRGLMTAKEVLNRVLAIDKKKGYAFSRDDFMPIGTREGPAAGIEPGMRGLRVDAGKIQGLHGLRRGDRFDLIATQKLEKAKSKPQITPLAQNEQAEDEAWDVSTRIIAQNGKIVEPVRLRRSVAGRGTAMNNVEEAFIGVSQDEITGLTEALALGAEILCVPRSGVAGAPGTDLSREPQGAGPGFVEVYTGGKRTLQIVPRGPELVRELPFDEQAEAEEVAELSKPQEVVETSPTPAAPEPSTVEPIEAAFVPKPEPVEEEVVEIPLEEVLIPADRIQWPQEEDGPMVETSGRPQPEHDVSPASTETPAIGDGKFGDRASREDEIS